MDWKILGSAVIVTTGLFVLIALLVCAIEFFPISIGIMAFIGVVALVYTAMKENQDHRLNTEEDEKDWED